MSLGSAGFIIKIRNAEQITIWKAMTKTPASIALIIYTFIAVWFVGGLSVFHLYLMSTNQVKTVAIYILAR
jgi:palmitoyltransferase ZDHHC9/14/18